MRTVRDRRPVDPVARADQRRRSVALVMTLLLIGAAAFALWWAVMHPAG